MPWVRSGCLVASSKVSAPGHSGLHLRHLPKVGFMSLVCTETCGDEHASQLRWDSDIQCHTLCPGSDIPEDQDRRCVWGVGDRSGRIPGEVAGSKQCWAPLLVLNLKIGDCFLQAHFPTCPKGEVVHDCSRSLQSPSNSEGVAVKDSSYWLMHTLLPHLLLEQGTWSKPIRSFGLSSKRSGSG